MPVGRNTDHAKLISQIIRLQRNKRGRELNLALLSLRQQARQFFDAGISFKGTGVYVSTRRILGVH